MQPTVDCLEDSSLNNTHFSSHLHVDRLSVIGIEGLASLDREIVTHIDDFRNLEAEWTALGSRSRSACVFMQWEWHYTWWQIYAGKRDKLHIVTWRRGGELVGLLPMYRQASLIIPGNTCLRFIGTGEKAIDEVATEYGDLLADNRLDSAISTLAAEYLHQFDGWVRVELFCMLEDSLLNIALQAGQHPALLTRSSGLRYRLRLPKDEETYLESLGSSRAKRIRRSQRAVLREGGLELTVVDSVAGFDSAFRELAELNHERQAHMRRKSVFASTRFRQFHQQLCARLHATDAADIIRIHLGSRLLAVLYCFYDGQTCHYYQSGFSRKDSNRFMPLTLAHLMEMQRSRQAGKEFYDFMRGEPPTYKEDFNCETSPMIDVACYRWAWQKAMAVVYRRTRAKAGKLARVLRQR
ncbi:GNAT family N-acetyltransferase [Granulosicoccus antarcticus]|uniref:BioF2-like acetyltransferase domain-containing protein n=1 Tax=Granulosicoccus antarcticus IMCC3135 TaxID=1192854 RepID=A0A2Z2P4J6_9GAMM|nr:GNAT family N-acetyltransferase [Granulosicoccus antarcticus]ASJ75597.1 hypothetical protein IMCC3135_27720 [Granulosicoccus antarcticus IMCC3135]